MLVVDNPWIGRTGIMTPRLLATDGQCSGGSCPAVYDSDADLAAGDIAVVGALPADGLAGRLAGRIAGGEALVTISRELVESALRPADEPISGRQLEVEFATFSHSAFRREARQHYAGTARDEEWISLLRANRRWGRAHQRVHYVTEPLTDAMVEELTVGYEGNVAAGEDIRVIITDPGDVPGYDYWLFDSCRLYLMHYDPDGAWAGVTCVHDPARIVEACRARDEALHRATPWCAYITSRPDLQRRLAQ
jgi:uncharacterized protein DUF6879